MVTAIKRSAQSVLHQANISRDEANHIGEALAERLSHPETFAQAAARYGTQDEFEIGELAAREYVQCLLG